MINEELSARDALDIIKISLGLADDLGTNYEKEFAALDRCVEKSEAKKLVYKDYTTWIGMRYELIGHCPVCNTPWGNPDGYFYCSCCGQKLIRGDEKWQV